VKVKIITRGELKSKIELETQFASKSAVEAIKKAGGSFKKVEILKKPEKKAE
jgi:ribosomal protein L15